jgi:hypothetical protein
MCCRKTLDDGELDSPEIIRAFETEFIANVGDQFSYNTGKASEKHTAGEDSCSQVEALSKFNGWTKILGPKKMTAPKRVIGQYFLDLGQSDFSHSTCPTCGLFYARGHESDEKIHKAFHKNCTQGIMFKVLSLWLPYFLAERT